MIDSLYLVSRGVPFDVAFSLTPEDRMAWIVALGTIEGRQFDWSSMRWKDET